MKRKTTSQNALVNRAVEEYRMMLESELPKFNTGVVSRALAPPFKEEQIAVFKRRAEIFDLMFTRRVKVNFDQTVSEAASGTWKKKDIEILERAFPLPKTPDTGIKDVDVVFFYLHESESNEDSYVDSLYDLEASYDYRDLKPAHPLHLIAVHKSEPKLAKEYPGYTHWPRGITGYWNYAAVWGTGLFKIDQSGGELVANWWFAGVPK